MKDFVVPPEVILVSGSESDSSDEEEEMVVVEEKPKEQWDCESIISKWSNVNCQFIHNMVSLQGMMRGYPTVYH